MSRAERRPLGAAGKEQRLFSSKALSDSAPQLLGQSSMMEPAYNEPREHRPTASDTPPHSPTAKRRSLPAPSPSYIYPRRQVIRLEYGNDQMSNEDYYSSTVSVIEGSDMSCIEATYQPPPPPLQTTHASPIVNTLAGFFPRPDYLLSPMEGRYQPPSPSLSPPQTISPSSRSHSPTSTLLPDYASTQESYYSDQSNWPPLRDPIHTSYSQPARLELAPYLANPPHPSPSTARAGRPTPPSLRIPNSPVRSTTSTSSTDETTLTPRVPSSHSSGGTSATSSVASQPPPSPFVYPGSRSVGRPKEATKLKLPKKPWRRKDSAEKPPEAPYPIPSPPTVPSPTRLPTPIVPKSESRAHTNMSPRSPNTTNSKTSLVLVSNDATDGAQARQATRSTPKSSPPIYVLPSGRSRAHPKVLPRGLKTQHEEKRTTFHIGGLFKKKPKAPKRAEDSNAAISLGSRVGSEQAIHASPASEAQTGSVTMHNDSLERAQRIKSRIGDYPLDPYNSVLLDNDRQTGELLARLNPTGSPSFHNYGNDPPTSVLDLGCGQGLWVVDAAIAWKGYGTKVTGYDMVDITRGILPWAIEQGVGGNIRFVRGNFLKQRLPFENDSFDLVRMSCLALCIPENAWIFVLQEVYRVLKVGGRLELIDDLIFFPYGKAPTSAPAPNADVQSIAPRVDVNIPTASFTRFSIYDDQTINPGLGLAEGEQHENFHELRDVEEEEEEYVDDATATVDGGGNAPVVPDLPRNPRAPRRSRREAAKHCRSWNRGCSTSGDLEALFEHMLHHKFGINMNLNEFVLGVMKEAFGHAREVKEMHLTLAPLDRGGNGHLGLRNQANDSTEPGGGQFDRPSRWESTDLLQAPGLALWPSTFIPMDQSELEIHASKHFRMLLSCKIFLLEHAMESTENEEIDQESVLEAFWEYEGFLRRRFDPPPLSSSSGDDQGSDSIRTRDSVAESVFSDVPEAVWENQTVESRQRFVWQRSLSRDRFGSITPGPSIPLPVDTTSTASSSPSSSSTAGDSISANPLRRDTDASNAAPVYSRDELTHVRTFRVYEAIKLDETIFGQSGLQV